jgi:hypothetical protein
VIRQTRIYLAGGISSTALIAAAVVVFVVLVSLQTFRDWPLNGLGGHRNESIQDRVAARPPVGAFGPVAAGTPAPGGGLGVQAPAVPGQAGTGAVTGGTGDTAGAPGPNHEAVSTPRDDPVAGLDGSAGPGSVPSGGGARPAGEGGSPSLSETVAGTVNETVSAVDNVAGGALGTTGTTGPVEAAVKGAIGPESPVGRAVDGATEAVGGLPGGDR